ncbi:hypothetical protein GCM10027422_28600 [Hymenobacter arcticus]
MASAFSAISYAVPSTGPTIGTAFISATVHAKGGEQNQEVAGEALQKVLAGLYQQGYTLKGSVNTYAGSMGTFVFSK